MRVGNTFDWQVSNVIWIYLCAPERILHPRFFDDLIKTVFSTDDLPAVCMNLVFA